MEGRGWRNKQNNNTAHSNSRGNWRTKQDNNRSRSQPNRNKQQNQDENDSGGSNDGRPRSQQRNYNRNATPSSSNYGGWRSSQNNSRSRNQSSYDKQGSQERQASNSRNQDQYNTTLNSLNGLSEIFDVRRRPSVNNNKPPKKQYRLGFKALEDFSSEEPDQLIVKLLNASSGFSELLNTPNLSPDYIVLIVRTLARMSESTFDANKSRILTIACIDAFISELIKFIMFLPLQTETDKRKAKYFWNDPDDFFMQFSTYCEMLFSLSPSVAIDILPKLLKAVNITVPGLKIIKRETIDVLETLQEKMIKFEEEIAARQKKKQEVVDENEEEPPDDFRKISVYPLAIEIVDQSRAFVRKNIIEGPYKNVDHYLDIQFRLLREDFVKPLREGIGDYIGKTKKAQNVKIYKNVRFLCPYMVNSICGVLIQLEIKDRKIFKRKIENSRRFMFGALMCFTSNNFNTVSFGKIVGRDVKLLENGQLVIEFEPGMYEPDYESSYVMVESSVYFEPYYHVLKALQMLNEENFPMKKYIVDVSNKKERPCYHALTQHYAFDDDDMYDDDDDDMYDDYDDDMYDDYDDPRVNPKINYDDNIRAKLNDAQYKAYQSAMNYSFSIIQGPPGTGKTYLGLVVVKSLLKRHAEWYQERYPLLVVCFTNHALDQFLEGLLPATREIIRIGGQSKNKNLEQFNIRNLRKRNNSHAYYNARSEVEKSYRELTRLHNLLDVVNNFDGIVNILDTLQKIPDLLGSRFQYVNKQRFQDWLLGGQTTLQRRQAQREQETLLQEIENNNDIQNELEDLNAENYFNFDDIFAVDKVISINDIYITSLSQLEEEIRTLRDRQHKLNDTAKYDEIFKIGHNIRQLEDSLQYIQMRMEEGKTLREYNLTNFIDFDEPHNIHPDDRWQLYFYWLDVYRGELKREIDACEKDYQICYKAYEELREIEDVEVMRSNLVVGMTTTAAARLRGSLIALKSPIVVVEEAAEIMESHVVTSLTKHCAHLILIGDHQQLRPNTADYTMEKKYYLGISLFERMITNNIHCNVLSVQHRMRPEIAKLVAPNIYPHLENHESVYNFPPICGVNSNLYFITHEVPEEECVDQSKSNLHEVKFLLCLAKYLLLNGYGPEDITIIAAYSGQMFAMFHERKKHVLLKDVRITVLDNYQGEECKIILLSLVRNNDVGKIGFLSLENRVCVALSRAREGLYIMGNIDLLCSKSEIWPKVRTVLEEQDSLGTSLKLRCQIHYGKITDVANENDFYKVSEGGCDLICNQILPCGHCCKSKCHILNRDHNEYQCKEKCTKVLCESGHVCPSLCYKDCGNCMVPILRTLPCGHESAFPCFETTFICQHLVSAELPCKHIVENKPCYKSVEEFRCPYPCDTRLDTCGHACTKSCHVKDDPDHLEYKCFKPCPEYRKNCSLKLETHICPKLCWEECIPCDIVVKKKRSCSHFHNIACSSNVESLKCERPCKNTLPCGHLCKLKCCDECGSCMKKVMKTIPECGHEVLFECSKQPTTKNCVQRCPLLLPCGHSCRNKCKDKCTEQCMELVDSIATLTCGHSAKIPCHMNNHFFLKENMEELLTYCRHPCGIPLECKHICSGSCGQCYQGRIHKICTEACGVDLICGHKCNVPCRQICPPCSQPCMYKCRHSKCKKKCGDLCTPCREFCPRRCKHIKCTAKCSERCTRNPCTEHCSKILRCGHPCIGFCGEPCPPLCLVCDREELLDFCLGYEDEEDARFVLLEECNHVIESRGMEMWLERGENEITVKRCPKCRTPLTITRRYNNYIKKSIEEIQKVKVKFFGEKEENTLVQTELIERLKNNHENNILSEVSKQYVRVYTAIGDKLKYIYKNRRQTISKILGQILKSKIQILEQISVMYKNSLHSRSSKVISYIDFLLKRLLDDEERMTAQEVDDYMVELKRLRRILQLADIEKQYPSVIHRDLYTNLSEQLFSCKKYDISNDENIKRNLVDLAKQMGGALIVSDQEMQQIVKAIGVRHGAWYKCPNGHPYAIGECGGAMQEAKCADCGARIGGRNHALLSDNQHFNVDGSRHAAWSEQANMINYRFD